MIKEIFPWLVLVLDDAATPVIELVPKRMGFAILENLFVNRQSPVTFQQRLVDGLKQPYLDNLRRSALSPDPAHVVKPGDDAEALAHFKGIRCPIEDPVNVVHNHEGGLPPPFQLGKDRSNIARGSLDRHCLADIAKP